MTIESNLRAFSWTLLGLAFLPLLLNVPHMVSRADAVMLPVGADPGITLPHDNDVILVLQADYRTGNRRADRVWIDRDRLEPSQLAEAIASVPRSARVVLRADARLEYGEVVRFLRVLQDAGHQHVILRAWARAESCSFAILDPRWVRTHAVE